MSSEELCDNVGNVVIEELLARHKKEIKDLTATVTGMKKQANKKTRKQVNAKCIELEKTLKEKHAIELKELRGNEDEKQEAEEVQIDDEFSPEKLLQQLELEKKQETDFVHKDGSSDPQPQVHNNTPKKKRNRQKERLARREAEENKIRGQAENEAADQVDYGKLELDNLKMICEKLSLVQFDILPDGNCLFASISDQLKVRHQDVDDDSVSVKALRERATKYILANRSTFEPFLFDEETMAMGDIDEYCEKMKNTSEWGGDLEILALAHEFNCPISVMMSGSAVHRVNVNGVLPELKLVYYKHAYGLGEHYNSLRDA